MLEEIVVRPLRSDAAARLRRAVPGDDAARIQDTMAFIRAHASDRLSVDELARRVAMSPLALRAPLPRRRPPKPNAGDVVGVLA